MNVVLIRMVIQHTNSVSIENEHQVEPVVVHVIHNGNTVIHNQNLSRDVIVVHTIKDHGYNLYLREVIDYDVWNVVHKDLVLINWCIVVTKDVVQDINIKGIRKYVKNLVLNYNI